MLPTALSRSLAGGVSGGKKTFMVALPEYLVDSLQPAALTELCIPET